MAPRLRPEVIIPIRSSGGWARALMLSCCAFIMFVTTLDALRYAAQRDCRPAMVKPTPSPDVAQLLRNVDELTREVERKLEKLEKVVGATSSAPR